MAIDRCALHPISLTLRVVCLLPAHPFGLDSRDKSYTGFLSSTVARQLENAYRSHLYERFDRD